MGAVSSRISRPLTGITPRKTIARLKFNRPIELQSGSGFKIQDLEEKFPWNLES